jgi:hypothetical protein
MEECDKPRFSAILVRLSEVFQRDLTPLLIDEYFKALRLYSLRQVVWAGEECIKDCLFFPKPKEIIAAMFAEKHEGEAEYVEKPLALPEYHDPEVYEAYKRDVSALMATIAARMRMPTVTPDEIVPPAYGEILKRESFAMTEKNWRARWDLARQAPDLAFLREAIPERLRIEFAIEDHQHVRETNA